MKKKIIITAGPTNERIDSVMQITNMSTGSLGATVADRILKDGSLSDEVEKIWYISPKLARKPAERFFGQKLELIEIRTAEELQGKLRELLTAEHIDAVVHSAAVGDYKAKYSIRAEDLVDEIVAKQARLGRMLSWDELFEVFDDPVSVKDDSGKMSSYEPHLMTMMQLTPKVIGCVKETSPSTMLIGFKLLDGVPKDELIQVAERLREKNHADYIVANDLSKIGNGRHPASIVGEAGIVRECLMKEGIADAIASLIFGKPLD